MNGRYLKEKPVRQTFAANMGIVPAELQRRAAFRARKDIWGK